jgi:hypothetical protein
MDRLSNPPHIAVARPGGHPLLAARTVVLEESE